MTHAIPTVHRGIRYRSRLEARWAAFFDEIGWRFVYEPFDGNGYIPDFLIYGTRPLMIEVKPAVTLADYEAPVLKVESGLRGHWNKDVLIVGVDPWVSLTKREGWYSAGLLCSWENFVGENQPRLYDRPTIWDVCVECGATVVTDYHTPDFPSSPCGHDNSDPSTVDVCSLVQSAWANACNAVQWRAS